MREYDDNHMLSMKDDAARVNWGGRWRMPSHEDFNELVKNSHVRFVRPPESNFCFWWLISQINGASLVFPDTGFKDNYDWEEEGTGFYWASDQNYYQFYEDKEIKREINVSFGLCIRPVIKDR